MIYKILVINGCVSLIIAGILMAIKFNDCLLGIANIFVGTANLIFMLR